MVHITGTIIAWSGESGTGSLKASTAGYKDKQFSFQQSNIAPLRFSAPYEPKVGDLVTAATMKDNEEKIDQVMEYVCKCTSLRPWYKL